MKGNRKYENIQDAHGEDLARGLIVGNIDDNETSSTETISEACSAALLDHDYTYYMDEADKKWLDDTNHGCCVEEPIVHERRAGCTLVLISADEFELVMGLFEILTGPKIRSQHQLWDFSFFQPFFQAPLHPDTFASHVVPAWVPPPSVLTSITLIIHPHWQQRRSLRGGHKIFPLLNNDKRDCTNAAYVCFRNTLMHRTRSQSLKAGGHGQIGRLRMDFFDQRLANKHERLTKGSPKPRRQSNPHIQTRTEKDPAYATEGITISPPSIREKTEQNGNANHNSLKTTSSIPQPVIQSENVRTQSARAGDAAAAKPPPRKPGLRDKEAAEAMNSCDGIGDRVELRIRGDGRREVVVAGSKTREVVFGSEGVGDLGDVVYGRSEVRGATARREHVVGLQGTRSRPSKCSALQDQLAQRRLMLDEKAQLIEMQRLGIYTKDEFIAKLAEIEAQYAIATQRSPAKRPRLAYSIDSGSSSDIEFV
ncbi:hypothetical protein B0H13DRAFT_1852116 [Mycena leptocephala]|nr:hypothetical protein B0H13DRAFT_1852116 [Mycena leptocephala]